MQVIPPPNLRAWLLFIHYKFVSEKRGNDTFLSSDETDSDEENLNTPSKGACFHCNYF